MAVYNLIVGKSYLPRFRKTARKRIRTGLSLHPKFSFRISRPAMMRAPRSVRMRAFEVCHRRKQCRDGRKNQVEVQPPPPGFLRFRSPPQRIAWRGTRSNGLEDARFGRAEGNLLNILLAEDNPGDVLLVRRALDEYGVQHELCLAHDGGEALELVARMGKPGEIPCPDVILLDLNLPKADGLEVLTEFRKHPDCANTPVIMVTSADDVRDRARMAELRISRYFKKPMDLSTFMTLGAVVLEVAGQKVG